MSVLIREAHTGDEARQRQILVLGIMSSYGRMHPWLEPILADPETPLEPADWTLVAEDAGAVLGYAAVTRSHLENLFVDPAAQGRGIGSALLEAVEARVRPLGRVTLRCLCVNRDARRLYDRRGYRVRETQTIVLHHRPLEAWLMEKPLT